MDMTAQLTEHAQKLIDAIKRAAADSENGWVNRRAIADALGKKSLNSGDIAVLDLLAVQGYVEMKEESTRAPSGIVYVYRTAGNE